MKEVKHNRTDFIAVYDEVYTNDQCKELISYIDKLKDNSILINEAEKTNGNIEHFTLNMAHEYDLPAWSWVGANINDNMQKCVNHRSNSRKTNPAVGFAPKFCAEWYGRKVPSFYSDYFRDHFCV